MPDPQGLELHDVMISQTPQFDRGGRLQHVTVVTYYVGDHGPFTDSFSADDDTPEKITSAMNTRVANLRRVLFPAITG